MSECKTETKTDAALGQTRALRLRYTGVQVDALSDNLKSQLALLDEDELAVVGAIKAKLNNGLSEAAKRAADTVGGFVW